MESEQINKEFLEASELAVKIQVKVNDALAPLELEMMIHSWSPDLRALLWSVVVKEAAQRAENALEDV